MVGGIRKSSVPIFILKNQTIFDRFSQCRREEILRNVNPLVIGSNPILSEREGSSTVEQVKTLFSILAWES